jgi:hypothetical protein
MLSAAALYKSEGHGAEEFKLAHGPGSTGRDQYLGCQVFAEQPRFLQSIVVLVYDPLPARQRRVAVDVTEGSPCPLSEDCNDAWGGPERHVRLREAFPGSGVFMGAATIDGSHGTLVSVRYSSRGSKACVEEAHLSMSFH